MFKCNICSKNAEYIYRLRVNGRKFDIISKIQGKCQLQGTIFLCEEHYVDALRNNW